MKGRGNLAGTSRVTVSKILNRFAKNNWISTHYRSIIIQDADALQEFTQQEKNQVVIKILNYLSRLERKSRFGSG